MGDSSTIASSGTKKKKKGIFKSIGKGLSYKKKKKRPDDESLTGISLDRNGGNSASAAAAAAGRVAPRSVAFANDHQTIPKTTGGGSSSATTSSSSVGTIAKPIQVVLLLMDPASRRFELLQLEFDSNKAMVSDVLRQIQCSATETTLRDMNYVGVCDQSGMEMISSMKLSKFCKGDDIVLAMPDGMRGVDTAKLAGPILSDPKVEDMLVPSGAKVQSKPVRKSRSATRGGTKLTKIAEEDIRRKERKLSSSPRKAKSGSGGKPTEKKSSSILPTAILGILISSLLFVTVQRHVRVTKPLESGDSLHPGEWKSQCGIFDLFPEGWLEKLPMDKLSSSCDVSSSSMLELGRDGTLRYFTKGGDGEREETWSVAGGNDGDQCVEGGEEKCPDEGATFWEDGTHWYVEMGGIRNSLNEDVIRDFTTDRQNDGSGGF